MEIQQLQQEAIECATQEEKIHTLTDSINSALCQLSDQPSVEKWKSLMYLWECRTLIAYQKRAVLIDECLEYEITDVEPFTPPIELGLLQILHTYTRPIVSDEYIEDGLYCKPQITSPSTFTMELICYSAANNYPAVRSKNAILAMNIIQKDAPLYGMQTSQSE
jgi:hypothetical protein